MLFQKATSKLHLLIISFCIALFSSFLFAGQNFSKSHRQASFLSKCYMVQQGQTVRAQIRTNDKLKSAQVKFLSKKYDLFPLPTKALTYECYIPIECEGKTGRFSLLARLRNRNNKIVVLKSYVVINKRNFPKQKGFGVSASFLKTKVNKEESAFKKGKKDKIIWKRAYRSSGWLSELLSKSPKKHLWQGKFVFPTKVIRYSTPFGEIRNSSIWGRYLHKGVDIVSPPRYNVKASQCGKIVIRDRFKYSGNTVVIDHGLGVFTYYLHLDSFANIKVGDLVKKEALVGRVGNTGYSTGYHLHWGLSVNNELVDPLEWTTKKFD